MDLIRMARHMVGETDDPHEVSTGDDGITIKFYNDEDPRPRVTGGPEPPQLSVSQAQEQLAAPTPVERNATPALTRAETIGASRVGERYATPSFNELLASDNPVLDLLGGLLGGQRPRSVQAQDPTGQQAWLNRTGPPPGLMMGSIEAEPLSSTLGEIAKGGATKLRGAAAAAAKEAAKLAKALESVAPELRPALESLANRYPTFAKALATHGTPVELQGANRGLAAALDRTAEVTHDITRASGGASVRPLTGELAVPGQTSGFTAGKFANQTGKARAINLADFSTKDVKAFMEQHADTFAKDPNLYLGTWVEEANPEKGTPARVWLDVAEKHGSQRQAVVSAAKQRQPKGTARDPVSGLWPTPQEAVYNLKGDKSVPVGNFAEHASSPLMQQRLDEMFDVGQTVMNGKDWWNLYGSDLERVYGKERVAPLAAMLASTSPASAPVHNLRTASEYLRRLINDEPIIQPKFRIPESAIGSREGTMGAMTPGDYNSPGTKMPMERTRAPNLRRAAAFDYSAFEQGKQGPRLQQDKVNDMFHALTGMDVGVYDRRYAKLFEDWDKGIYAESTKDKLQGSMKTGKVSSYALVENALRDGAKRHNMSLSTFTSYVWEGIGETIKKTGKLYGMKQQAHSIPEASLGFPGIFNAMVEEKAKASGFTVPEFEKLLREGKTELLTALLATPVGMTAYRLWQAQTPDARAAGPPPS